MQPLRGRVLALSPHLDDAVWSVGGLLADAARAGASVTVATVLAGDPESKRPAGRWDVRSGFRTEGRAAEVRGLEDRRACSRIGVEAVHFRFGDETYERGGSDDDVWSELGPLVGGADVVLLPGFPLTHGDHAWLAHLVLSRKPLPTRLGLYAEQPYAMWQLGKGAALAVPDELARLVGGSVAWRRVRPSLAAAAAKLVASHAYESQLRVRRGPYRLLPLRLAAHDIRRGGEALAWVARQGEASSAEP